MPLIQSVPWAVQPQTPVRLAQGLPAGTFAYIGGQRLLIGGPGYVESGTITGAVGPRGKSVSGGTTASYIDAGKVGRASPGALTIVAVIAPLDSSLRYFAGTIDTGTNYLEQFAVNADQNGTLSAGKILISRRDTGGVVRAGATTNAVLTTNKFSVVVLRIVTGTTFEIWVDGVNYPISYAAGSGTLAAQSGLVDFNYDLLAVNVRGVHSNGSNVGVALFARIPSNQLDAKSLSINPWQLFAPLPRTIWVPAAAGGGTSIAGALGTAVASGFKGNVNANRTIAGALGAAVASGFQGTVTNGSGTAIAGNIGVATASGFKGGVAFNRFIAGLLGTATASGFTGAVSNGSTTDLALILKILRNRQELNASTGTFTLYDDDGTTVLYQSNAWADAAGTIPYSGGTLARIDALA